MNKVWRAVIFAGAILTVLSADGCHVSPKDSADWNLQTYHQKRDWNQEKDLRVRLNFPIGKVILQTAPEDILFSLEVDHHDKLYRTVYEYEESTRTLRFELKELKSNTWLEKLFSGGSPSPNKNRITLRLSTRTILNMELKAGVGAAQFDFTGMQIRSLKLETGVGETTLHCNRPNPIRCEDLSIHSGIGELEAFLLGNLNFQVLDYKGGIGSSYLDLSGSWNEIVNPEIHAEVGIGELLLRLPVELGAEILSSKHLLNNLKLDSFLRQGNRYVSKNYDQVQKHMLIRMDTGIGSMRVCWQ